ncbi:MAG TPA: hypothetical protein VN836_04835 [Verrucomicrobiae bacterium]|nr:hypothetical protein [Verrucomicrobiae bacterium]
MTNYTQIKICEIPDPDFQSLITELCHCVVLGRDQFVNQPLSFLLMAIVRERRVMTRQHLPTDGILTVKVDKLLPDSVVYDVCQEMVNRKGAHIESFDGKTVLSLIKHCYKAFCPPFARPKKPTRKEEDYQLVTKVINQRRRNGDL